MIRRRYFAAIGLSALAVAALAGMVIAQAPATHAEHAGHDDAMQACAKACSDCQRACDSCATHCANQLAGGHKEHLVTLGTCRDCADFCATAAQIVSRGGPFANLICNSCAEACAKCGKECAAFPDDKHMKMCADECRACEKACREMLKHTVGQAK